MNYLVSDRELSVLTETSKGFGNTEADQAIKRAEKP